MRALILLAVAGCSSPAPPVAEPDTKTETETGTETAMDPIQVLRVELPPAITSNDFSSLARLVAADRPVAVTAGCGESSAATGAEAVLVLLRESTGDFAGYDHPLEPDCDDSCCRIESGAPTMCEVCVAALTICLEGSAISAITIEDTDGVICPEPEESEDPDGTYP